MLNSILVLLIVIQVLVLFNDIWNGTDKILFSKPHHLVDFRLLRFTQDVGDTVGIVFVDFSSALFNAASPHAKQSLVTRPLIISDEENAAQQAQVTRNVLCGKIEMKQ